MVRSTQAASARSSTFSAVCGLSTPNTSNCDTKTPLLGPSGLRLGVRGGSGGSRRFFRLALDRDRPLTAALGPYLNAARLCGLCHRKVQMQNSVGVRRLNVLAVYRVA